jgi:hypothetical protein
MSTSYKIIFPVLYHYVPNTYSNLTLTSFQKFFLAMLNTIDPFPAELLSGF